MTSDGTVGVRFYDLRRDRPGDATLTTDSWFRHSHDRGPPLARGAARSLFDLRTATAAGGVNSGLFLGDYQAVVALPDGFATVFARARPAARQGPSDIFFTRIKLRRCHEPAALTRRLSLVASDDTQVPPPPRESPPAASRQVLEDIGLGTASRKSRASRTR